MFQASDWEHKRDGGQPVEFEPGKWGCTKCKSAWYAGIDFNVQRVHWIKQLRSRAKLMPAAFWAPLPAEIASIILVESVARLSKRSLFTARCFGVLFHKLDAGRRSRTCYHNVMSVVDGSIPSFGGSEVFTLHVEELQLFRLVPSRNSVLHCSVPCEHSFCKSRGGAVELGRRILGCRPCESRCAGDHTSIGASLGRLVKILGITNERFMLRCIDLSSLW